MARLRPPRPGVRRASVILFAASCAIACEGDVVNLGNTAPLVPGGDSGAAGVVGGTGALGGAGGAVQWRAELVMTDQDESHALANPALPLSMEYVLFTRQLRGAPDPHIWRAQRGSDGNFAKPDFKNGKPLALGEDTENGASNPALSASGDELWFGMGVTGSASATDVYVALAEGDGWGAPQRVDELSSMQDDAPRPLGQHGTVMPLSSTRHGGKFYQIYFANRDASGTWLEPNQDYLATINLADKTSVDGFLTNDGLTLYFAAASHEAPDAADLYRALRSRTDEQFGEPELLRGVNTSNDERDPWLSEGGEWLYYSSNRTGFYAIYRARRVAP
jgi:hypothetical protein